MIVKDSFEIKRYVFDYGMFNDFQQNHYASNLWPVVYILSDGKQKEAYVGETTDTFSRMLNHLKNEKKNKLTAVHLISSHKFNKSATLDIESNLIKYISGDGQYKLMNGNIGLANHNYYQKQEIYWNIFKEIWDGLRAEGISKHPIEYIDNSDLFKYSPYKSLTNEQIEGLSDIIKNLLQDNTETLLIEGGAGTGKTVLATFLFKLIYSDNDDLNFKEFGESEEEFIDLVFKLKAKYPNPKMALVVPMTSFRNTLKSVFKNVKGLSAKMVMGPAEVARGEYDIVLVDESHRLRRRINLGTYFGAFDKTCELLDLDKNNCSELDWILLKSKKRVLFYDANQSIKPSDAVADDFIRLKHSNRTKIAHLKSQLRVRGGNDYVSYINKLLNCELITPTNKFSSKSYDFKLFDSIKDLKNEISKRNKQHGLSRLVAGYSWPWISKNNNELNDIIIEDVEFKWNSISNDWVNSENAINEIGCIHTTQGYDLNYAGIIFGNEISYDKNKNEIVIIPENYHDKNGKQTITNPDELKKFIINIYKTILLRGIKGTYIYACDKELREYLRSFVESYESSEQDVPALKISEDKFEDSLPLYDLKAAAGSFSDLQTIDGCKWVELPLGYRNSSDLFACYVIGESMNKIIPNGSICLFRKYTGGSRDGKIVLVEHTNIQDPDFGSGYTIKEYHSKKVVTEDEWHHQSIYLKPLSTDPGYQEIVIEADEMNSLKVIGIFEQVLQ
jgi:DUF2075 family protein/predicted GIY-YIG superfamily endonuclease